MDKIKKLEFINNKSPIKIKFDKGNYSLLISLNRFLNDQEYMITNNEGECKAGIGLVIQKKINNRYEDYLYEPIALESGVRDHIISENDFNYYQKIFFYTIIISYTILRNFNPI